jgi:hypothetical protein
MMPGRFASRNELAYVFGTAGGAGQKHTQYAFQFSMNKVTYVCLV